MKKSILLAIVLLAFTASTFAQVTQSATSTAVVVAPITITTNTNLDLGSLAATGGGTLTIDPATSGLTASAGVAIIGGTPSSAQFTINGAASENIIITYPASVTLSSGANSMAFAPSSDLGASPVSTALTAGGTRVIYLGGVLTVGNGQAAGTYTSAAGLTVTVNYN